MPLWRHGVQGVLPVLIEVLLGVGLWLHHQCIVRAHLDTHRTSCAIIRSKLNCVVLPTKLGALRLACGVALGACLELLLVEHERPNHGMRADDAAQVALGALVRQPHRHLLGQTALLMHGLSNGCLATCGECTCGKLITSATSDGLHELLTPRIRRGCVLGHVWCVLLCGDLILLRLQPRLRVLDLVQVICSCSEGSLVRGNNLWRLLAVHAVNGCLELLLCNLWRQNVGQVEEGCLHDLVDALCWQSN
mmetsp:Transcript_50369/g.119759  ORF Transcript_50369/g.119759 Transcript_50369/m.119759 type:complete len:249 (-) Transcript_50369:1788-2534(-)